MSSNQDFKLNASDLKAFIRKQTATYEPHSVVGNSLLTFFNMVEIRDVWHVLAGCQGKKTCAYKCVKRHSCDTGRDGDNASSQAAQLCKTRGQVVRRGYLVRALLEGDDLDLVEVRVNGYLDDPGCVCKWSLDSESNVFFVFFFGGEAGWKFKGILSKSCASLVFGGFDRAEIMPSNI